MLKENKIYQGDCLELFKKIEESSVDLIIADPPYGIDKDFGNGEHWNLKNHAEWFAWMKRWLEESSRVLKPGGSMFVYGIHHNIGYVQAYLYDLSLNYGRQFIWHYENSWSKYRKAPASSYEPLLWFYKGKSYTYHEMRVPYKSTDRLKYKIIKNGKVWRPNPAGKSASDVWDIPVLAGKRFEKERVNHPTQKPLKICDRIIVHFSNPGDLVLVPFAGSGSECVSAKMNDRKFVGFELNKKYIAIAEKRLANAKSYSSGAK
jgi:site-specific DNA-methyltransferase (adenine-specific)